MQTEGGPTATFCFHIGRLGHPFQRLYTVGDSPKERQGAMGQGKEMLDIPKPQVSTRESEDSDTPLQGLVPWF